MEDTVGLGWEGGGGGEEGEREGGLGIKDALYSHVLVDDPDTKCPPTSIYTYCATSSAGHMIYSQSDAQCGGIPVYWS